MSIGRARRMAGATSSAIVSQRQLVAQAGGFGAAAQHGRQLDVDQVGLDRLLVEPGRVEHVIDQRVEPLDVVEHEAIEIGLLLLGDVAARQVCKYSFSEAIGDFSSWLTLSMKFDCRWLSRIPLIDISRYSTTPTSTSTERWCPRPAAPRIAAESVDLAARSAMTQPTISATDQHDHHHRQRDRPTVGGAHRGLLGKEVFDSARLQA